VPNIDFAELKKSVPILDVVRMLNIEGLKPERDAFRGTCPMCNSKRTFVVTPGRGWYCHGCKAGGDIIKLVAAMRRLEPREAALAIQEHFGNDTAPSRTVHRAPDQGHGAVDRATQLQRVLDRLQPEHQALQGLGISAETARQFESGYNPSGVQAKRYSVAIRNLSGELVTFAGIALDREQSPRIAFSSFEPASMLFNEHRIAEGTDLMLCRTPLDAILAVEQGAPIESVTAFLTESVSPRQLEILSSLMDQKKIESLWL